MNTFLRAALILRLAVLWHPWAADAPGAGATAEAGPLPFPGQPTNRLVTAWEFDRPGDLEGWQANGELSNVRVAQGVLSCRAVGSNPILELQTPLELVASPWHSLEIRLKANRDGVAEMFWSNTSTGRYGGFSQDKTTRFNVEGDGDWHTYRLLPCWHPEKKIVRLRLDVFGGAEFAIDSIRILEPSMPAAAGDARFDFAGSLAGWQALRGAAIAAGPTGMSVTGSTRDGFALAPPVQIPAEELNYLAVRLAVDQGTRATLCFATAQRAGLHQFSFPVEPGAGERTYNLDLLAVPEWRGRVIALGLQPSDVAGAAARVRWLRISDRPEGPPQLQAVSFALEEALPRVGRPATVAVLIANSGGEPASNLVARLHLPPGLALLSPAAAQPAMRSLGCGEELRLAWPVQTEQPLTHSIRLTLSADHAETLHVSTPAAFSPKLDLPATDYVPKPQPVRGPFEVGVYYFPGWKSASQWHPITRFPERRPVLGWYREGEPEIADWHIKWAVEHGITFFAYDWYWSQGSRQLEHALHDGYFKARYRHLLKFCLLWANHNAPGSSSPADCLAVTRCWIDQYFRRPEHLTVDGKPAVIIFSPHRLTEDLGSAGVKPALEAMRAECRQAGLKGLHLIACVADAAQARQAAAEGYDAVSAYNWPGLGMTGPGRYAPFDTLPDGYRRNWLHIVEHCSVPLAPLPINGGWDSRPWHGDNNLVRFGRTPELFRRHLADARRFLEARHASATPLHSPAPEIDDKDDDGGPARASSSRQPASSVQQPASGLQQSVLIEAWNEWGEGSYIEPHKEFGFGYLDAIRDVFTAAAEPHLDLTPADVGLGPYDVPSEGPPRTEWDFTQGDEGWVAMMQLAEERVAAGVLTARTTGTDPAFTSPPIQVRAGELGTVVLRVRLRRPTGQSFRDRGQLFWRTSRLPESEASSTQFEVVGDGQWHDYTLPVAQNRRWRGLITRLRLDPCNQAAVTVEIDSVRLQP